MAQLSFLDQVPTAGPHPDVLHRPPPAGLDLLTGTRFDAGFAADDAADGGGEGLGGGGVGDMGPAHHLSLLRGADGAPGFDAAAPHYTTIGNWRQKGHDAVWNGETYYWSHGSSDGSRAWASPSR